MAKVTNPGLYDVVREPIVTEKAFTLASANKYVFEVAADATKPQVKQAIEEIFGAKVESVNVINLKGKNKRFKGFQGKRADKKKAIVTLKAGETIEMGAK